MFPLELHLNAALLLCESIDDLFERASSVVNLGLATEEQGRYAAFRSDKRQREYVASRYLAKHALAQLTGVAAGHWKILRQDNGAALVQSNQFDAAEKLFLSISHCTSYCAVTIARHEIGIDLQSIESLARWQKIQTHVFSTIELSNIQLLQVAEQATGFTELWALKEALGKLHGTGLKPKQHRQISFLRQPDDSSGNAITLKCNNFILAIAANKTDQLDQISVKQGLKIKRWHSEQHRFSQEI
jgi:phosphopantetheinyl transferase